MSSVVHNDPSPTENWMRTNNWLFFYSDILANYYIVVKQQTTTNVIWDIIDKL